MQVTLEGPTHAQCPWLRVRAAGLAPMTTGCILGSLLLV